jgi:hypothetical protein
VRHVLSSVLVLSDANRGDLGAKARGGRSVEVGRSGDMREAAGSHTQDVASADRNPRLDPLDGWSAATFAVRGGLVGMSAVACVVPLALASVLPGGWIVWTCTVGAVTAVLLALGGTWSLMSYRKETREMAAGYTTGAALAKKHPELTYLSHPDFAVISGPSEPRPRNGSRKAIAEHLALRGK